MYPAMTNSSGEKRVAQQSRTGLRQVSVIVEADTEVMVRQLLTGLLISMAAVALLTAGCQTMAQVPTAKTGDSGAVEKVLTPF